MAQEVRGVGNMDLIPERRNNSQMNNTNLTPNMMVTIGNWTR